MRQKGIAHLFLLVVLVIVAMGTIGYFAYQNAQLNKGSSDIVTSSETTDETIPSPTLSEKSITPTSPAISNWENYSNTVHKISFNYPSSWTLSETKGQSVQGVTYNTQVILVKDDARINMYFNMDGIGGMPQEYDGSAFVLDGNNLYQYRKVNSHNNTKLVGISNSLETLGVFMLDNITYSITLEYPINYSGNEETELLNEFDQILSAFKFTI